MRPTLPILFLSIFLIQQTSLRLSGQHVLCDSVHTCRHHISMARLANTPIGIYDQDARLHDYDVKFYGLDLKVNPLSTRIEGSVSVLAQVVASHLRYFVLELINDHVVSRVLINDEEVAFTHEKDVIEIDAGASYLKGALLMVEVFYQGEPRPQGFFSGIQSSNNSFGDPVLWTLSEPHNARQWFPVKQVLNDKADSVYVFITTPSQYKAASNGLLRNVTELPGGYHRYEWKSYYPIAFYLISMAISNYQEYNFYTTLPGRSDSLLIQNFIYNHPQSLASNRNVIDMTAPMIQLFSELWGLYPFATEKYGHAMAPMAGAMEHQTISTMGGFGFDITVHELAHHWYGNNVTCATWSDIWINEGFASYAEYLAREFLLGEASALQWMNSAHNNIKSQPGGSVFVPRMELPNILRIFDGRLSYRKGAAILHQLRFEINDDPLFFLIMQEFQHMFADDVATGDDFRRVADLLTGRNWEWFFDQWYYGEGFPAYEIKWWQQEGKLYIRSAQTTSASFPSFFAGTLEFDVVSGNETQRIRMFQEDVLQTFSFDHPQKIDQLIFDPRSYMLKNFTLWDSIQSPDPMPLEIGLYPNPFDGAVTIRYPEPWHNGQCVITDIRGAVVASFTLAPENRHMDLGFLAGGIYNATFYSPNGIGKTIKIMKW